MRMGNHQKLNMELMEPEDIPKLGLKDLISFLEGSMLNFDKPTGDCGLQVMMFSPAQVAHDFRHGE